MRLTSSAGVDGQQPPPRSRAAAMWLGSGSLVHALRALIVKRRTAFGKPPREKRQKKGLAHYAWPVRWGLGPVIEDPAWASKMAPPQLYSKAVDIEDRTCFMWA
jgi:hypothetical protein